MDCEERILLLLETAARPISMDTLCALMPDIERNELNAAVLDLAFEGKAEISRRGLALPTAERRSDASSRNGATATSSRPYNRVEPNHKDSSLPSWPWPEFADPQPASSYGRTQSRDSFARRPASTPDVWTRLSSMDAKTAALAQDTLISDILNYDPILKRLKSVDIYTIADYATRSEDEILAIRGFGLRKLADVNGAIGQWLNEMDERREAEEAEKGEPEIGRESESEVESVAERSAQSYSRTDDALRAIAKVELSTVLTADNEAKIEDRDENAPDPEAEKPTTPHQNMPAVRKSDMLPEPSHGRIDTEDDLLDLDMLEDLLDGLDI